MVDCARALYADPVEHVEGLSARGLWLRNDLPNVVPNFTVTRERSLYLVGTRRGIMIFLSIAPHNTITIQNGSLLLLVKAGGSGVPSALLKVVRTAAGAAEGAGLVVSNPVRYPLSQQGRLDEGPLSRRGRRDEGHAVSARARYLLEDLGTVFSGNPFRGASKLMTDAIKAQQLKDLPPMAVVEVASGGANAFAAAARQPADSSNSDITLLALFDMLLRRHDFPRP